MLKLENAKDTRVSFGEPLGHVITLRGPTVLSEISESRLCLESGVHHM